MTEPDSTDGLTDQIKAHPALALAGGLALGMIASALLPKGTARKLARSAAAAAAVGSEAGLTLARQASETARNAAGEAGEHLEKAGEGARHFRRRAASASGSAASAGMELTRAALRLLGTLRR